MEKKRIRLSAISILHYVKLTLRSALFLGVLIFYILGKLHVIRHYYPLLICVWVFFVIDMVLRFFPSRLESMGCKSNSQEITSRSEKI